MRTCTGMSPLPPGVPYDQQQFRALMAENGVLQADDDAQAALARAISNHLSEAHNRVAGTTASAAVNASDLGQRSGLSTVESAPREAGGRH